MIGYADDLALVGTARTGEQLRKDINIAIEHIEMWMVGKGLQIEPRKIEVVLLSDRRKLKEIEIGIRRSSVKSQKHLTYLGIVFDKDMRMTEHVKQVTSRVNQMATQLATIMPNVGGPRASKRRVINSILNSVILYAAPIWSDTLRFAKYRNMLEKTQRKMTL